MPLTARVRPYSLWRFWTSTSIAALLQNAVHRRPRLADGGARHAVVEERGAVQHAEVRPRFEQGRAVGLQPVGQRFPEARGIIPPERACLRPLPLGRLERRARAGWDALGAEHVPGLVAVPEVAQVGAEAVRRL